VKGKEKGKEMGKEGERKGREGRGRDAKRGEGICRTSVKLLPYAPAKVRRMSQK